MRIGKLLLALFCMIFIIVSISNVYATDTSGTYTGALTEGANPVDVYLNGEYIGEYKDYRMYQVNLDRNQKIKLKLEVPDGADFDLFVYNENESKGWGSMSDVFGQDEEMNVTIPEAGIYKFYIIAWSGSGSYTLRWETVSEGFDIYSFLSNNLWIIVIIIVVIIAIIILVALLSRRRHVAPPIYVIPPSPYAPPPQISSKEQKLCPTCGGLVTWIQEYQRWYCYRCSKYV
ncbi:MAG: hypothetical protein QXX08_03010 [Candidatus Bathyarchaeia archaeon]